MRTDNAVMLVFVLLVLAALPWIANSCAPRPLLPDGLRQERDGYTATVEVAQEATLETMRKATSVFKVQVIGTIEATPSAQTPMSTENTLSAPPLTSTATIEATPLQTNTVVNPTESATKSSVSVIIIQTAVATGTSVETTRQIVVRPATGTVLPTETPTTRADEPGTPTVSLPLPSGLVDTDDIITEEMLTAQVTRDADDDLLSDLVIELQPTGVSATGEVSLLPRIKQQIEVSGTLGLQNYGLVFNVTSIRLDEIDVTEQYRGYLESRVNSSLYALLPQRFVQSYELMDGQIHVYSKIRP